MFKRTWETKGYDKIIAAGDTLKFLIDAKDFFSKSPESYKEMRKVAEIALEKLKEGLEEI